MNVLRHSGSLDEFSVPIFVKGSWGLFGRLSSVMGCPGKKSAWVPQRLCNPLGFLAILRICFTPGVCLGWAWGVLGVCLGCAWGVPGRAWGVLGVCLGCAWGVLGRAWGVLGVTGVCLGLAWGVFDVSLMRIARHISGTPATAQADARHSPGRSPAEAMPGTISV